jgi:hypothetical protein
MDPATFFTELKPATAGKLLSELGITSVPR